MAFDIPFPAQPRFPILAPDGTAAAPSYSFSSDTNCGFYYVGFDVVGLAANGAVGLRFGQGVIDIPLDAGLLRFGVSVDTVLVRDGAANTLVLRNSTNAQGFRVYNTYTDASNYERARFSWVSNWLEIGTSAGGTGVSRGIVLMPATGIVAIGGTTSSFPAIKRNATGIDFRLADDSNYCSIQASSLVGYGGSLIYAATTIPVGGSTSAGYKAFSTTNFGVFFGSGAPTLSAAKGSLYLRSDGSGVADRMYVNTDGSTTWTAVATVA